jgi:hypothetical protein
MRSPGLPYSAKLFCLAVGYAGLGNKTKAGEKFNSALNLTPDFLSAKIALGQLEATN